MFAHLTTKLIKEKKLFLAGVVKYVDAPSLSRILETYHSKFLLVFSLVIFSSLTTNLILGVRQCLVIGLEAEASSDVTTASETVLVEVSTASIKCLEVETLISAQASVPVPALYSWGTIVTPTNGLVLLGGGLAIYFGWLYILPLFLPLAKALPTGDNVSQEALDKMLHTSNEAIAVALSEKCRVAWDCSNAHYNVVDKQLEQLSNVVAIVHNVTVATSGREFSAASMPAAVKYFQSMDSLGNALSDPETGEAILQVIKKAIE